MQRFRGSPVVIIVGNIIRELGMRMKGRPYGAYSNDLRVRIEEAAASAYRDVAALCGERRFPD